MDLLLPETLAVILTLQKTDQVSFITPGPALRSLFRMIGDTRVSLLNERILAGAFVFCGLRNLELGDSLFESVDPQNNASVTARTQILGAPNTDIHPVLIAKVCDILGLDVDDFRAEYQSLVRPVLEGSG